MALVLRKATSWFSVQTFDVFPQTPIVYLYCWSTNKLLVEFVIGAKISIQLSLKCRHFFSFYRTDYLISSPGSPVRLHFMQTECYEEKSSSTRLSKETRIVGSLAHTAVTV